MNLSSAPVVPDKYYNASLSVLTYAFYKQHNGEWKPENDDLDD